MTGPRKKKLTDEQLEIIKEGLKILKEGRNKWILANRYGLTEEPTLTLREIGERYGISGNRVMQIEMVCLRKIAKHNGFNWNWRKMLSSVI